MAILKYFDKLNNVLTDDDIEFFMKIDKERFPEYHFVFGKIIRQKCHFWKNNTEQFKKDLKVIIDNIYTPDSVDRLKKRNLSENMKNMTVSLNHPDNASHVLMDIFHDFLNYKINREQLEKLEV